MATVWRRIHLWLGIPSVLAAALAGLSASKRFPGLAICFSIISAVLTALLTFLTPEKVGAIHHAAGIRYSDLRGRLRRLRLLDLENGAAAGLRQHLENLAQDKIKIMQTSPHIGGLAYRIAKASIERAEHRYAVDS